MKKKYCLLWTGGKENIFFYKAKKYRSCRRNDFTYFNATYTVENALSKVKDDKGMKRVESFKRRNLSRMSGNTFYQKKQENL